MKPFFKLFLEDDGEYVFGPGRAELLSNAAILGSLHKAAQKQGMSYRWAWGRIRETEKDLGVTLLMSDKTSGRGNTKKLTPEALELLEWFSSLQEEADNLMEKYQEKMPSWLAKKV